MRVEEPPTGSNWDPVGGRGGRRRYRFWCPRRTWLTSLTTLNCRHELLTGKGRRLPLYVVNAENPRGGRGPFGVLDMTRRFDVLMFPTTPPKGESLSPKVKPRRGRTEGNPVWCTQRISGPGYGLPVRRRGEASNRPCRRRTNLQDRREWSGTQKEGVVVRKRSSLPVRDYRFQHTDDCFSHP